MFLGMTVAAAKERAASMGLVLRAVEADGKSIRTTAEELFGRIDVALWRGIVFKILQVE